MRKLLFVFLLIGAMLLLPGCGQNTAQQPTPTPTETPAPDVTAVPVIEQTYTVNVCLGMEGYTIDPTFLYDGGVASLSAHLFEGLTKYVPASGEEPEAVSSVSLEYGMAKAHQVSEDGLTYTFTLRDDVYWSDGQPVTAQDFVYAWQRLVTPAAKGQLEHPGSRLLAGIVLNAEAICQGRLDASQLGVKAPDDRTLEVRLEEPCAYFLKICADPCLVPLRQDVIEEYGGDWTDVNHLVVNGAYTISEWVHDDFLEMVGNPAYYGFADLGPESIVWHFSEGDQSTLDHFWLGTYDFISAFPQDQAAALKADGTSQAVSQVGTYYLYFNMDVIADWRVRAAMMLSVDRDAIVDALGGDESPATGFVSNGIQDSQGKNFASGMSGGTAAMYSWLQGWYQDYDLTTYEGRCQLAKVLYQESLNAKSWYRSYEVTYCYNTSTTNRTVAKMCQKNWSEVLGLNVNLSVVDRDSYGDLLENGNFGVAYLSWIPDYDDAQNFLELMDSQNPYNYGMWSSTAFDALLEQISGAKDAVERDELLYYAENQMFSLGGFPVCPIYFYGDSYCVSDELTNVGYSPFGYYYFQYAQKS